MKKWFSALNLIVFLFGLHFAYAAQYKMPLLVMDMSNASHLPNHFRTSQDRLPPTINNTGLRNLHIAGGSQFSKASYQRILSRLHQKKAFIIDLREESHGFLNGNAVSWYAPNDAINAGKTDEQIEESQTILLDDIAKRDVVDVFTIMAKSKGYVTKVRAKQYAVHQVMSEAQFADAAQQDYTRIYVQDTMRPEDKEVDRFLEIIAKVPKDEWIYFHCRAGIGRTTTFMTMYDMMQNAKTVSFDDILTRQHALGGKDLEDIGTGPATKKITSKARLEFLQNFYNYAKANDDNFKTTWTEWLQKK